MATPLRPESANLWNLDPTVAYLNHGSFGACPKAILEHQRELQARMEREPVDFLVRRYPALLQDARERIGEFIGADPEGLAFIPNATTGVNAAVRSWHLEPGDEILTTDHAYDACRKSLAFVAARRRAVIVTARLRFPLEEEDEVVEAVAAAVTPRTRLALLDHVASPTALVLPVARLVAMLRERGVETIVDGAHAIGMIPPNLDVLGSACYTANAHKWLCAPKGASILHVRRDLRDRIRPLVVSHGYDPASARVDFRQEWDWTGTVDPTAWLSIPECIRYLGGLLPGGWPELMERNHMMALRARGIVGDALGIAPACPERMVGSMASLPLPQAAAKSPVATLDQDALATWTRERGVESWFCPWACPGGKIVRLSAQLYNHEEQYRALAAILRQALLDGS